MLKSSSFPIYFIIYINCLPLVSNKLFSTLYADDTNFSYTDKNFHEMVQTINTELEKAHQWTVANRLTINTSKTELLVITNRKNDLNNSDKIILKGEVLNPVNHVRFLGCIIDENLNFKHHLIHIVNKISKHAGLLYRIKNCLPISARIIYYNSFVLPYLSYNIVHWGNTNAIHLNSLIMIQKRIIRSISNADFLAHTTPLFYRLGILKVEDLYKYNVVLDTYKKIKEGKYAVTHDVNTRSRNLAKRKDHKLTRCRQSLTYNGPTQWNLIPDDLRNITSFSLFKNKLKIFYLQKYSV